MDQKNEYRIVYYGDIEITGEVEPFAGSWFRQDDPGAADDISNVIEHGELWDIETR